MQKKGTEHASNSILITAFQMYNVPSPFTRFFRLVLMQTERHMKPASQPVLGPYLAATRETVAAALSRAGPVLQRR